MLKIAIVGCGKVADQHVQAIHRIPDCEIVALCDREPLMAKQLGERCGVTVCFSDAREMLQSCGPMSCTLRLRPRAIILLRQNVSTREVMFMLKNLSLLQPARPNRWSNSLKIAV